MERKFLQPGRSRIGGAWPLRQSITSSTSFRRATDGSGIGDRLQDRRSPRAVEDLGGAVDIGG